MESIQADRGWTLLSDEIVNRFTETDQRHFVLLVDPVDVGWQAYMDEYGKFTVHYSTIV